MSRRNLVYAALVVASFVVSACAQPTAPTNETYTCPNGVVIVIGSGATCGEG